MIKINFCGDFKCDDVSGLELDPSITKILKSGSINVVNFEAPVKAGAIMPISKDGPNIFQADDSPLFLRSANFNLFSLANNHIMDYGEDGYTNTVEHFKEGEFLGAGTWEEAYRPVIKEIDGIKIGFLALCHHEFGILQEEIYEPNAIGAAWLLHPCVDEIIINTKKECDFFFVFIHGGYENEYYPLPEFRSLYKHFIRIGADGVVACHPHTPQPWEIYHGKPIFYSLGNFCFDSKNKNNPYWNWSILLSITIQENSDMVIEKHYCYYDNNRKMISMVDNDFLFNQHINEINQILRAPDTYLDKINTICKKHENRYYNALLNFCFCNISKKRLLKLFLLCLLNRVSGSKTNVLNALRCETHRWLLSHSIEERL